MEKPEKKIMANVATIGKAKAIGTALQKITGVEPSYLYEDNFVRIYFQPDRLQAVQTKLAEMAASGPSDVRIDWFPIVSPMILKKGLPVAIGLLVAGYIFGKLK